MASDDINLDRGDPERADSASERRRRRRQTTADSKTTSESFTEREVREQLTRAFDGLAKGREAREDHELAEAIREEGDAMTEGFVTLTNNVKPLRLPLVILLNVVITVLAFGRVGSILWYRFTARRAERQFAREQAAATGGVVFEEQ